VVVLGNLASAVDRADAARLRAAGIPVLEGTATGLAALRHLLARRDFLANPPAAAAAGPAGAASLASSAAGRTSPGGVAPGVRARWRERLADPRPLGEVEALAMLADWVVPVVAAEEAASLEAALAAAGRVGWPVALKTAAPRRPPQDRGGRRAPRPGRPGAARRRLHRARRPARPVGGWSRGWPKAAWSWPSGWSATRSSGRW
jgi:hypothetical protein